MGVESTGVVVSSCVEVWQSGHGALEVVLLHSGEEILLSTRSGATVDNNCVFQLNRTCPPVNVIIIMTTILTIMTLYSLCSGCQRESGSGAGVVGRQDLRASEAGACTGDAISTHQQEASRRSPACVAPPPLLELVTLLPALPSQGYAAGLGSCSVSSSTCHQPVLSVAVPPEWERWH